MCGIFGVATIRGRRPSIDRAAAARLRDTMTHRGPDGAGLAERGNVTLGHRRLAVIDLSPTGDQPMSTPDGRFALVYNGELYNDAELRGELEREGVLFRGRSDAETVLHALSRWGGAGLARLRGMFALALHDEAEGTLLLARDPLGIKPLYYAMGEWAGGPEVVFASEVGAILGHPHVRAEPDLAGVSAYLTTIRTVLGDRTMFRGVVAVRAGESILLSLSEDRIRLRARRVECDGRPGGAPTLAAVESAVADSIARHLRSDVPVCCLLSGGLDSSIVAAVAAEQGTRLDTYCSGHAPEGTDADDFSHARLMAARLGSRHTEVPVSRGGFAERWAEMVASMGVPLSTPNEVAIYEVARRVRADGKVVALSGEGADELFGGYGAPLMDAAAHEGLATSRRSRIAETRGGFQLLANAWMDPSTKASVLSESVWRSLEGDAALRAFYEDEFAACEARGPADSPLQAHLRFQRRVNLTGLLQRLDSATMLASVEGRTPLADVEVCRVAESLPMAMKFSIEGRRTKIALREAFAAHLPREVVERPKASFPLPFQEWVEDGAAALHASAWARELFAPGALDVVARSPGGLWHLAWPMINVAMWGRRWWG